MSILCYHSVHPQWRSVLAVPPDDFDAHCEWLAARRTTVPLQEAVARLDGACLLPRGLSALTFDDGFADLYHHAWPSLRRRGLAATVFLVAETLSDTGREVDWVDDPPSFRLTTLDREQVLEMQEAGITFGSHTYSHPDLTAVTDEECERELRASKQLLEALVGREVPFLAYPRGRHNARVRRAAERVGYVWAFSLPQGRESVGRYATPRVGVYGGNSLLTLRVKSTRFYQHTRVGRSKVADRV